MANELEMQARAGRQRNHLCRLDVLAAGGSDSLIRARVSSGRWRRGHAGCVLRGTGAGRVEEPPAGGGPRRGASCPRVASRRARPLGGARRAALGAGRDHGIPVTTVERTLIDCAAMLPPRVVEEALDSAVRRKLTTHALVARELRFSGGRGVLGTRVMRALLAAREDTVATGSAAEVAFLRVVRGAGIQAQELQVPIRLPDHTVAVVDFMWRDRGKIVEVDGLDAHGSARSLEADLDRQNQLLSLGYELRRYSGRTVRRRPEHVAAMLLQFLEEP